MNKILVIGSSNIDMVAEVDHLPNPGETVGNAKYSVIYGGKGANQALAAAKVGGNVTFVSSLGNDAEALKMIDFFNKNGIDTKYIRRSEKLSTGVALIMVNQEAENCIAVAPEANFELTDSFVDDDLIRTADLILMQMEIPYETIRAIAIRAKELNTKLLFNPAPAQKFEKDLIACIDILVVNETEAEIVSGLSLKDSNVDTVLQKLHELNKGQVILTLGANGVYLFDENGLHFFNSFIVDAVDTTAAGDTFCGVLATFLARGNDIIQSIEYAIAASAISVTRFGAQTSFPDFTEIEEFLIYYSKKSKL